MKKYAFGVDIGGTTIKLGLFKTSGDLLDKWEIPTRTQENGVYILNDIAEAISQKMAEKSVEADDVEGIGVGVPGPVGDDGTVYKCVNLGWSVFNVAIELERKTGFKVKVGNDANVAALGEMWQGGGKIRFGIYACSPEARAIRTLLWLLSAQVLAVVLSSTKKSFPAAMAQAVKSVTFV